MNEKLIRLVLVEGLDDWTPIDRVISVVRECEEFDEEGIRDVVRDVLSALLERDLVTVGKIGSGGFESKSGPARDLVAEVVSDLDDCNWVPQGGSYWLANTAAADSLVADGSV